MPPDAGRQGRQARPGQLGRAQPPCRHEARPGGPLPQDGPARRGAPSGPDVPLHRHVDGPDGRPPLRAVRDGPAALPPDARPASPPDARPAPDALAARPRCRRDVGLPDVGLPGWDGRWPLPGAASAARVAPARRASAAGGPGAAAAARRASAGDGPAAAEQREVAERRAAAAEGAAGSSWCPSPRRRAPKPRPSLRSRRSPAPGNRDFSRHLSVPSAPLSGPNSSSAGRAAPASARRRPACPSSSGSP